MSLPKIKRIVVNYRLVYYIISFLGMLVTVILAASHLILCLYVCHAPTAHIINVLYSPYYYLFMLVYSLSLHSPVYIVCRYVHTGWKLITELVQQGTS